MQAVCLVFTCSQQLICYYLCSLLTGGPRVVNNWRGGGGGGERGYTRTPRGGSGGGYHAPNRAPPPTVESKPLKYTKDFDFESANALFSKDQFEKEMELKLKISDDKKEGGSDGDEPITSEHEEPEEGEIEEVPTEGAGHKVDEFYDKSKSFFDSISCESTQSNTNRLEYFYILYIPLLHREQTMLSF